MNDRQFAQLYCVLCSMSEALGGGSSNGAINTEILTGSKTYTADSYRSIQFMNTSSADVAVVNGENLPPLGTVSYSFPRDTIVRPAISATGNAAGLRVDYETW